MNTKALALALALAIPITACASAEDRYPDTPTQQLAGDDFDISTATEGEMRAHYDLTEPSGIGSGDTYAAYRAVGDYQDTPGWADDYSCRTLQHSVQLWFTFYMKAAGGSVAESEAQDGLAFAMLTFDNNGCAR